MIKHCLIAAYIFSTLYCYIGFTHTIDEALKRIKENHPSLPFDELPAWKGLKLNLQLLALSAIPVANIFLGWFFNNIPEEVLDEVVCKVETEHWQEIRGFEESLADIAEDAQECCAEVKNEN